MDLDAAAKKSYQNRELRPTRRCICDPDSVLSSPCLAPDFLGAIAGETYLDRLQPCSIGAGGGFHTLINLACMAKDRIVNRRDLPHPPESAVWAILHPAAAGIRGVTVALCSQKAVIGRAPAWNCSRSKDIPSSIPAVFSAEEGS